jgi:hypothetical protein
MKILVLSTPKTGNAWLVLIVSLLYQLPIVDIPEEFVEYEFDKLPDNFVGHQHLFPNQDLCQWMNNNNVIVISTIRHPLDTLISYINYVQDYSSAEANQLNTHIDSGSLSKYIMNNFYYTYQLSSLWHRLGSIAVRYEDLIEKPIQTLEILTSKIKQVNHEIILSALLASRPDISISMGFLNKNHISTNKLQQLNLDKNKLLESFICDQYRCIASKYGYDVEVLNQLTPFNYNIIDPFGDNIYFDNGAYVTGWMKYIYYQYAGNNKWNTPIASSGDSYWNWLKMTDVGFILSKIHFNNSDQLISKSSYPTDDQVKRLFTNFVASIYKYRADVQHHFPDPIGNDFYPFLAWLVFQSPKEIIAPSQLFSAAFDIYIESIQPIKTSYNN